MGPPGKHCNNTEGNIAMDITQVDADIGTDGQDNIRGGAGD